MTTVIHAVPQPVLNDPITGGWDHTVTTLCGMPPNAAQAWSIRVEYVTCPSCRGHKDFDPVGKAHETIAAEIGGDQ